MPRSALLYHRLQELSMFRKTAGSYISHHAIWCISLHPGLLVYDTTNWVIVTKPC